MASRALLDLAAGHVQIAGRRVAVRAVPGPGQLQVGGDDGPVLRSPTFGERSRLAAVSLGSAHPALALASALAGALRVRAGACDLSTERIVALLLSGAGESGPPLVETACLVARAAGSPLPSVEALDAVQVDLYARGLTSEAEPDDGWHRVVLAAPAAPAAHGVTDHRSSSDDEAIVQELAEVLIARARAPGSAALRAVAIGSESTVSSPSINDAATQAPGVQERQHASGRIADRDDLGMGDETAHSTFERRPAPSAPRTADDVTSREPSPRSTPAAFDASAEAPDRVAQHAHSPALRFRHQLAQLHAPHPARGMTEAPLRHAASIVAASRTRPSSSLAQSVGQPAGAAPTTASPSLWEPAPWRLARSVPTTVSAAGAPAQRPGAPVVAFNAPNANPAGTSGRFTAPARSGDDVADLVAESLRREAARRGLVP